MGKYFGTDGVRGKANISLTPELAFDLARAAATVLLQDTDQIDDSKRIIIGRDTRISGTMLEAALAAGFCSCGIDVLSLGVIPTPAIAVLSRHYECPGIVISASHNPFADNGIKFFSRDGYKLPDAIEDEIEALMDSSAELPRAEGAALGRVIAVADTADIYLDFLRQQVPLELDGMTIVLDAANGAACGLAERLFTSLGAKVHSIAGSPDGVNINDDCGSTHPQGLAAAVLKYQADIGIALDGDADRIILADDQGQIVDGDVIMAICAADMKSRGVLDNNRLVVTVMSNMGLTVAMRGLDIDIEETKVGDRYVLERMRSTGAAIGGEQSGHIIFGKHNTTGDGLLTALHVLEIITRVCRPLSELARVMQVLPQVLVNVPVTHKEDYEADADIADSIKEVREALQGRGRVLVRPSGTEQLLRVMAEGPDQDELQLLVGVIADTIKRKMGN